MATPGSNAAESGAAPRVSVIVCTYNQPDTLGPALDSILAQQVDFGYEIIVADDCSTDGGATRAVALRYAEAWPDRIRLLLNPVNKGLQDNYYDALLECRGEYVAELAGDDLWCDPLKLARQVELMDANPDVTLCHCAWRYLRPDGTLERPEGYAAPDVPRIWDRGEAVEPLLLHDKRRLHIHMCTALYRRAIAVGLLEAYPDTFRCRRWLVEDFQIEVMLAHAGKVAWLPQCVLHYRVGHPTLSSTENPLKTVRFTTGVILLTCHLARLTGFGLGRLDGYIRFDLQYAMMAAFKGLDPEARDLVDDAIRRGSLHPAPATRLVLAATRVRPVWRAALSLYRLLKS